MVRELNICVLALLLSTCRAKPNATEQLQEIVEMAAMKFNVSISIAALLDSGEEFLAASGSPGHHISTSTPIPAGSATKPFTAVGILQLVDAGLLDLDTPIVDIIDPWHAAQPSPIPSLKKVFADVDNISKVTTRHLISMKSGIPDYNNSGMLDWTLRHPSEDYLPMDYIGDVGKRRFQFKPGESAAYSSNGYVLAGMVLAAKQHASTWKDMDQFASLGPVLRQELKHTLFMNLGPCSHYVGVPHQYALHNQPMSIVQPELQPFMPKAHQDGTCAAESEPMQNVKLSGPIMGTFRASSYEACCEGASGSHGQAFVFDGANCTVLSRPQKGESVRGIISGWTVQHFKPSDIIDLYDDSCLNGWTMGNIAFAPIDAAKFWNALLVRKSVLKPETLKLMHSWTALQGWGNGMDYGYGLMKVKQQPLQVRGSCPAPLCACQSGRCQLNVTLIGHMGADWGSSMPLNGYLPHLNASVGISLTSMMRGLNSSLTTHENGELLQALQCYMFQVLLQHNNPAFPELVCPSLQSVRRPVNKGASDSAEFRILV